MQVGFSQLLQVGLSAPPRRSTLSNANKRRSADLFEELYHLIYHRYYGHLPKSLKGSRLSEKLFIVDSTIVSLFSSVMQSTGSFGMNGKKKGGIKAHVLVRAKNNLPCFVRLSDGKQSDNKFLPHLMLPEGSIVVMDKGYRNYQQFISWTNSHVSWISRLNQRAVYSIEHSTPVSDAQLQRGVEHDYTIRLGNPKTSHLNAVQPARLILYYDKVSKRGFQFITNNFTYCASTIADIYKKRWQIELLFKRIKQNFQLHYFLGDNENAIRIQLWCTLIADLLIKIIKDKADKKRKWSMATLSALIRLHLETCIDLFDFLADPERALISYNNPVSQLQLSLFPKQVRGT
jgi:transposase